MESGRGTFLRDVDGQSYIDYCLSWGPLILGHAHPAVTAAACAATKKGASFGASTEQEFLLAKEIAAALPSMELMRFTSSGTEAVMSALRAARAFTRRDGIVKFAGCYHGHVDSLLVSAGSGAVTLGHPDSAGVPKAWAKTTMVLPYNDIEAVRLAFKRHGDRIAAVIVEPVAGNMGVVLPEDGFLRELRAITRRHEALLIFDEVITGFRLCYGGAQTLCGIRPDITVLGKIVGGGFPVGVYGGRRKIMELISPLGPVYQAGTLSGNPVAVAAGLAALRTLKQVRPYARLERMTRKLAAGIQAEANKAGVPVRVQSAASMFTVFFTDRVVRNLSHAKSADTQSYARFFHALLDSGVYFPPAQFEAAFLSTAHTKRDIERTLAAVRSAFRR
jgi:glutamate-1-semialdehyde 2,1-aminomutase